MARFELTDEQWARLVPLLPPEKSGKRGHPYRDHRTIINGILWIVRTGAPLRDLPERYGPWQTCYDRIRRWQRMGIWRRVWQTLQAMEPTNWDGSPVEWYACAIDSTTIKAHPHAAGAPGRLVRSGHPQKGGSPGRRTTRRTTSARRACGPRARSQPRRSDNQDTSDKRCKGATGERGSLRRADP